jgi:hypothetical protein
MITVDHAEDLAARVVGAPATDPDNGWDLREFDSGWLILRHAARGRRGAGCYVIERAAGRVMMFPSYVPTSLILDEYDQVVADAYPEEPGSAS